MGDIVKSLFSFLVWTVEFFFFWGVCFVFAPSIALGILYFILGFAALYTVLGGIIMFILR